MRQAVVWIDVFEFYAWEFLFHSMTCYFSWLNHSKQIYVYIILFFIALRPIKPTSYLFRCFLDSEMLNQMAKRRTLKKANPGDNDKRTFKKGTLKKTNVNKRYATVTNLF